MISFEDLKLLLTPRQRKAAEMLVANDFAGKDRKTLEELSEEIGITRKQLYTWRQNPDFTRYVAAISDNKLEQYRSIADSQLLKLVKGTSNNGLPAIRGLELYYKLLGRMQEAPLVSIDNSDNRATMTRDEARKELDKYLN